MTVNTDTQTFLEGLGLSEKEAELYLHSLRTGPQTASTLSKKTRIARSTVNFLFEQLIKKGFAEKEVHEKTTYFKVIQPKSLEYILLDQLARTKKQMSEFQDLLPIMDGIRKHRPLAPKVTYYEGLESLYRMIEDCCEKDESVWFISSHNNMHPKIREYIERVYVPKSKKHIHKNKMILSDGEPARKYLKQASGVYDESILVDPQKNPFELTVAIHGDRVDFISYDPRDLSGVIIENPLIATHMRSVFEIMRSYFKNTTSK